MAFVFETESYPLYIQKERSSENLGPGQYLPITEFKFQNPLLVPFGVSTNRQFPQKPNPTPGPGSYYHDINKEKKDKIMKDSLKTFITKEEEIKMNKLYKYEPDKGRHERALKRYRQNFELLGFSSKVKRFDDKNRVNTPGPGAYSDRKDYKLAKISEQKCLEKKGIIFKTNYDRNNVFDVDKTEVDYLNFNKNVIKNNNVNNNKKAKNKTKDNSRSKKEIKKRLEKEQKKYKKDVKYRVSSIPSKNNKGYLIEPITGDLVRKANPDIFKIFSGDKDDAVGPGSYEIIFPEDWKKTGTSWSKYKWEKEPKKIRPKSSYNVNSINCQIGNYRKNKENDNKSNESTKINSELSSYYKSYTTKQLNYKDPTAHNIDTITEFIKKKKMPSFIPVNNNPGPGFYYDEEMMSGLRKALSPPLVKKDPYNHDDEILNEIFNVNKNNNNINNYYEKIMFHPWFEGLKIKDINENNNGIYNCVINEFKERIEEIKTKLNNNNDLIEIKLSLPNVLHRSNCNSEYFFSKDTKCVKYKKNDINFLTSIKINLSNEFDFMNDLANFCSNKSKNFNVSRKKLYKFKFLYYNEEEEEEENEDDSNDINFNNLYIKIELQKENKNNYYQLNIYRLCGDKILFYNFYEKLKKKFFS